MSGKRICVVVHYGGMGGVARSLPLRLERLAEEAELEFLVPCAGPVAERLAALGPVETLGYDALTFPDGGHRAPSHLLALAAQQRRFRSHFQRTRPDLVITSSMMLPTAVRAARRERIPVLVHCSLLLTTERLPSGFKRWTADVLVRRTFEWAERVVACSQMAADQFDGLGDPVEVVYPPIAEPEEGLDEGAAALRRHHGIPPGQACIAVVGNITRGRGQDVVVRAMPAVRERIPDARLLIVGAPFDRPRDIAYRERLTNLVRGLGLEGAVHFTGPVDRIGEVYGAADVVVNPARVPESFGRVACEATLAGIPVVSTRVGAVEEVLGDRAEALLVDPDDPGQIAGALLDTFADPASASLRVESGRARVQERFRPAPLADRFAEIAAETIAAGLSTELSEEPPAPSPQPPPAAKAPA